MDYEKAYKEAIERAKKFANSNYRQERYTAEEIFPQLRESDDEKIRKEVKAYINRNYPVDSPVMEKSKILNWLEKQKEQKPDCSDEDIEKDIIDYLRYERKSTSQEIEERFIPFLKKRRIMKQESISPISYDSLDEAMQEAGRRFDLPYTDENKYSIADVFYAGVRAERESKTWSEEDEKIRKALHNFFWNAKEAKHSVGVGISNEEILAWLEKQGEQKKIDYDEELKKCKDNPLYFFDKYVTVKLKQSEQKPVEWSEKDETMLSDVIKLLKVKNEKFIPCDAEVSWLNELPNRFNLQPKQEWGDEDEKMRSSTIFFLNEFKEVYKDDAQKCIAWLKSLKPQPKQEWSEEDDDMVKETIYFINEFQKSDRCKDENDMQNSVTCENWLKTLKPKHKQERNEEDIDFLISVIDKNLNDGVYGFDKENKYKFVDKNDIIRMLKSLKPRPEREWSEEDERILGKCIDAASGYYLPEDKQSMKDWLKSIKDRVHPKQEWSEEDEGIRKGLINMLSQDKELHGAAINWLKSIKPQPKQEWSIENASEGDFLSCKFTSNGCTWEKIVIFKSLNEVGVEGYGITLKDGKLWFSNEIIPYYSKTWTRTLTPATKEQIENFMKNICEYNSQVKTNWKPREAKSETKNKCPNYSEGYGCSTSPLKQCDTCPDYKLYNHWKPSIEQIRSLESLIEYAPYSSNSEELKSLLDELKTLRDYD